MLRSILRLAVRNATRRKTRTALTAGMVVASVALLLVALTWIRGVSTSMMQAITAMGGEVRIVDADYAAREELRPMYEHIAESAPLVELLRRQPGVTAVEPRIATGVTVTVGEEIGEVFALATGASESYFREQLRAKDRLVQGAWFSGAEDELVAGFKVVQQAGARLGDELVLVGTTQDGSLSSVKGRLVGVVRGAGLDQQVLASLDKLRWFTDIPEGATEILVYGADLHGADQLAASLRTLPDLEGLAVQSWAEREPAKTMKPMVESMQSVLVFIFVFLTALGIWNTMMMSVLERTHEIGVLRAMGLSRLGAVGLFVGEALAVAVAGGLIGVGLGAWPAWLLERDGITIGEKASSSMSMPMSETVHGDLTVETVFVALALGFLMALLGSLLPALRASSIQPVTAMRSGR